MTDLIDAVLKRHGGLQLPIMSGKYLRKESHRERLQDPENGKYVWDDTVIGDMLINPVYYGAIASQKKNYKIKVGVINEKKPDEWIIVENMHCKSRLLITRRSSFVTTQKKAMQESGLT